jgi:NAD(P) transhydrogenase
MAGDTEQTLQRKGVPFVAGVAHYAGNARGQIIGAREGFLKLIFHRETMQLLGVHIIGELASELVHTGSVALQKNAGAELFTQMCFNYPTLGELYKSATYDALAKRAPAEQAADGAQTARALNGANRLLRCKALCPSCLPLALCVQ